MQSRRSGVGREVAAFTVIVALIVAGTVFLWFPPVNLSSSTVRTTTGTPTNDGSNVIVSSGGPGGGTLSSFQTYQELRQFITSNAKSTQQYYQTRNGMGGPPVMFGGGLTTLTTTSTVTAAASTSTTTVAGGAVPGVANAVASGDYTTTNNQVAGVDELDRVKTDGSYLSVATSQSVSIIKAQGNATAIVATIRLPTSNILGISMDAQRLAIIAQASNSASTSLRLYDI
jgi:hypothetical protein